MRRKDRAGYGGRAIKGPRDQNLPRFRALSVFLAVCRNVKTRGGYLKSFRIYWAVFGHMRSYILIVRRYSRAIFDVLRDFSRFTCGLIC